MSINYKQLSLASILAMMLACKSLAQLPIQWTFEGGINYASLKVNPEIDALGNRLDHYQPVKSGQYGLGVRIGGADEDYGVAFSIKLAAFYLQQDWQYNFSGKGFKKFKIFENNRDKYLFIQGKMDYSLRISRQSIYIPLSFNMHLNPRWSVNVGGYISYALKMQGQGSLIFEGGEGELLPPTNDASFRGIPLTVKPFNANLEYDYLNEYDTRTAFTENAIIQPDSLYQNTMPSAFSAYSDRGERNGLLFNRLDAGVSAGITVEAGTWFASMSLNYGLTDMLNNQMHARQSAPAASTKATFDSKAFVLRNEMNRNIGIQFNIGFYLFGK